MSVSTLRSKGPSYSFQPAGLRAVAARLFRMCQDYTHHFDVGYRCVSDEARSYLKGLLMKAPRKNIERMGEYVANCDYESTQHFISESPWKHRELMDHVARDVDNAIGGPESVLDIDESAFTKKGEKSVGVARQYNGRLGKIDNCQVAVFGALTNGHRAGLIDARLYLPQAWIDAPSRCYAAGIPATEWVFKTKPQLGLEIIDNACKNNIRFGWVSFDGFYGNTPEFLNGLERRNLLFIGAVHKDQTVYLENPRPYLPRRKSKIGKKHTLYKTRSDGFRVDALNDRMDSSWHVITVRQGTKGYVGFEARRQRVWMWQEGTKEAREAWLVILKDPFTQEVKYYLSNADENVSLKKLVEKAACRFFIERTFEDAKTSVGMADYQVRVWNGWQHHMGMAMLAILFMLKERITHEDTVPLLSCQDIIELLNIYLPRGDRTKTAILEQMEQRHRKRQKAIELEYKRQEKICRAQGIDLTM